MLRALRRSAEAVALRTVLALLGAIFVGVGLTFGTIAAWQGLAVWQGPIAASVVMAAIYAGIGLILLASAMHGRAPPEPRRSDAAVERVVAAFFEGMAAGSRTRRPR